MGCPLDALTLAQTVARIEGIVAEGLPRQHMAVNAGKMVKMRQDPALRAAVLGSDLISADGAAIVLACRFLGAPVPERVAGIDLMQELLWLAPSRAWRPYFLGARPEVVRRLVDQCRWRYPGLDVAGARDGYFGSDAESEVAEAIRESRADLLFVGMSSPRKETFLARWLDAMDVPFCMGVGGAFDVLAGEHRRAPAWMREHGLEWAHRTILEPRRMWRRNLLDNARFVLQVLSWSRDERAPLGS
jgi:N-acetylglucosaminyldiphosphoundecaprenol N-acetyl-beta-D-mannosaminyltransferase